MLDDLHVYTVSQLNRDIQLILEDNFSSLWVEGEISNFRVPRSGHFYFTLKDESSQIRAVMFRRQNSSLAFSPTEGDHVLCLGRISVYGPRGEYQIMVESLDLKGIGGLLRAFEQLKAKLEAEGLFAPQHKKPIPLLPRQVAVITSATGAAVRDILQVVHRRFANLSVTILPVTVQGSAAAAEIVQAIRRCNEKFAGQVDAIILARGGGSWEDLSPFNEEAVARAIFASQIPLISAVGHETDYTIADFVADLRAPTPSAAAELVIASRARVVERLESLDRRLLQLFSRQLDGYRHLLQLSAARLSRPDVLFQQSRQQLDELSYRFTASMTSRINLLRRRLEHARSSLALSSPGIALDRNRRQLDLLASRLSGVQRQEQQRCRHAVGLLAGKLEACNPLAVLQRGYAVVETVPAGLIVTDAAMVAPGDRLQTTFARGKVHCDVREVFPDEE